jgi:hypothetical protein
MAYTWYRKIRPQESPRQATLESGSGRAHTRPRHGRLAQTNGSALQQTFAIGEACLNILRTMAAGLSIVLLPAAATAQDFPTKPIKLIVPFPPGGPNDIIARVIGQRMSEMTKQPIVIDNRGGQAGVLGPTRSRNRTPTATPSAS